MERRSGVVCADLIDSKRADTALYIIMCVYSHKRLACVTFPGFFEERKKKTKYIMHTYEVGKIFYRYQRLVM